MRFICCCIILICSVVVFVQPLSFSILHRILKKGIIVVLILAGNSFWMIFFRKNLEYWNLGSYMEMNL